MTYKQAEKIKVGDIILTKYNQRIEVTEISNHISWTTGAETLYIKGKADDNEIMKFSHKELLSILEQ